MNLKELEVAGITFSVSGLDAGFFEITADEIPAYLADPVGWYAGTYHVSREQVENFQRLVGSEYQCTARTRQGMQCRNQIDGAPGMSPRDYDPALDGFCRQHRPRLQASENCAVGAHRTVLCTA